ncbi:antibiotic biosynthesis monooxygenase [bacterium]|nr:antibiotic biosynthesis monooxygenase [bacterium]
MFVVTVNVRVKPEFVADFIEAIEANHLGTRTEPGNLRFDVMQNPADPAEFLLYEVYRSEEGMRAHQQTEHYLAWRSKVESWMAQPRKGTRWTSLFPESEDKWKS